MNHRVAGVSETTAGQEAGVTLRRLAFADAPAYRTLMLDAYAREPGAFTSTVAERASLPQAWWEDRVSQAPDPTERVFGAFSAGQLVGAAGLRRQRRERMRHKTSLFGLYVEPAYRGRGVGRALVEAVLTHAAALPGTRIVQLTVVEANDAARRLYAACGFEVFGTEPFAIEADGCFVSLVHMWRTVGGDGPGR